MEKDKLAQKIPIKSEKTSIKESAEAKEIKANLETLNKKKEKMIEIVNVILNSLNENNVVTSFIKVLQNKATESTIFNEKKLEFDEKLKQLETVSDEIKELKVKIAEKMEAFNKLQQNASKLGQENEKVNI
jgi:ABC-type transporter Mla subunit MlaD